MARSNLASISIIPQKSETSAAYWFLQWRSDPAATVATCSTADWSRLEVLATGNPADEWSRPTFSMVGELLDYLPNAAGVRLCSAGMRSSIDSARTEDDDLQWFGADVLTNAGERVEYFVLHLIVDEAVLDQDNTLYSENGFAVRPVVSDAAAACRGIFAFRPGGISSVVSDDMRESILAGPCAGVEFARARSQ